MSGKICDNKEKMQEVLGNFQLPKPYKRNWGNFRIKGNVIEYISNKYSSHWDNEQNKYVSNPDPITNVIAIKTKQGKLLGNASILPLVGQTSAWGNTQSNWRQTVIQELMEKSGRFQMIPFNVLQEAKLDVETFETLEDKGAETIQRNRPNPEYNRNDEYNAKGKGEPYTIPKEVAESTHFIGAQLFSVSGTKFLFDIDRVEITHGIFNPFLVEIPDENNVVNTVAEAYEMLIPSEVKQSIREGKDVKRQGEWFFTPTEFNPTIPPTDGSIIVVTEEDKVKLKVYRNNDYGTKKENLTAIWGEEEIKRLETLIVVERNGDPYEPKPMSLRAGPNRPNSAEMGLNRDGVSYVKGKISHTGREHKTIELEGWHTAQPNTAIKSFTITGDID